MVFCAIYFRNTLRSFLLEMMTVGPKSSAFLSVFLCSSFLFSTILFGASLGIFEPCTPAPFLIFLKSLLVFLAPLFCPCLLLVSFPISGSRFMLSLHKGVGFPSHEVPQWTSLNMRLSSACHWLIAARPPPSTPFAQILLITFCSGDLPLPFAIFFLFQLAELRAAALASQTCSS